MSALLPRSLLMLLSSHIIALFVALGLFMPLHSAVASRETVNSLSGSAGTPAEKSDPRVSLIEVWCDYTFEDILSIHDEYGISNDCPTEKTFNFSDGSEVNVPYRPDDHGGNKEKNS